MNLTPKNLRDAAKLIAEPGKWTKNRYARIAPDSLDGGFGSEEGMACFCGIGAVQKVTGEQVHSEVSDVFRDGVAGVDFACFNDFLAESVDDVVMALLIGAEFLESEGA